MDATRLENHSSRLAAWIRRRESLLAGIWTAACLASVSWTGSTRLSDTLPYVQHIDERTLMRGAKRVLQEGGLNPRIYNYPSLPFYLTAAGLAWGTIRASAEGPEHVTTKALGRLEPPFYDRTTVGAGARKLWVLLAVGCVAAAAGLAYALGGPATMALSAALLALCALPMAAAREYVNVDVPLALFVLALLWQLARTSESTTYRDRVWAPALLCGAAIACKYTGVVALAPSLLAVWLYPGPARLARSFELVALALLAFLLLCPRFLLDLPSFLDGISWESFHYNYRGHRRFTVESGLPQLAAYGGDVLSTFGLGLTLASAFGAVQLLLSAPRRALVFLSFPACWLALLASNKVHFVRNLLPFLVCVAVLAAHGVVRAWRWEASAKQRRIALIRIALVAALVFGTLPFGALLDAHRRHADSRNRFARWVAARVPADATLLIPDALPFAVASLPDTLHVQRVDLRDAQATRDLAQPGSYMLVPHWSTEGGGRGARIAELAPGMNALPPRRVLRDFAGVPAEPGLEGELSVDPGFSFVRFGP